MGEEFEKVKRKNATVHRILEAGGTLEDVIVGLDVYIHELTKKWLEAESVRPRRYRLANGTVMKYDCPDEFIKIEDLRNDLP